MTKVISEWIDSYRKGTTCMEITFTVTSIELKELQNCNNEFQQKDKILFLNLR